MRIQAHSIPHPAIRWIFENANEITQLLDLKTAKNLFPFLLYKSTLTFTIVQELCYVVPLPLSKSLSCISSQRSAALVTLPSKKFQKDSFFPQGRLYTYDVSYSFASLCPLYFIIWSAVSMSPHLLENWFLIPTACRLSCPPLSIIFPLCLFLLGFYHRL